MANTNDPKMTMEYIAKQLEALGNDTRLRIVQQLVKTGSKGLKVGEINKILKIPASTLSHHVGKLVNCGLVSQQRRGNSLVCQASLANIDALVMYLAENCCGEESEIWG